MTTSTAAESTPVPNNRHPKGLRTLFFTEMWERFSFYGMRGLLILFMTASVKQGGLGLDDVTATAMYGLYNAAVYVATLPGGWIADRLMGAQRTVWYGGIIIMLGHFTLAIPAVPSFYLGLVFLVLGTGLLKPNISAIVGELYPEGGQRRDAGFTFFYMGINLGALFGPLVTGYLASSEYFGWHYGFAAAGVGMLFGLIQYRLSRKLLGDAGMYPDHLRPDGKTEAPPRFGWLLVGIGVGLIAFLTILGLTGHLDIHAATLARWATIIIAVIGTLYFVGVFIFGRLDTRERKHIIVIAVLIVANAFFWSGFEQAGSSLNLFAERYTDRVFFNFEIPTAWFQSLNPMYILILAPFFASLWVNLGRRNLNPSIPAKFALGLIQMGLGFLVMYGASTYVVKGQSVLPTWLLLTYLIHTMGELCLSPVGLSAMTKLSPKRFVSQMMGIWFLSTALGEILAGLLAGRFHPDSLSDMPSLYLQIIAFGVGSGIILLLFTKPLKKLMDDSP